MAALGGRHVLGLGVLMVAAACLPACDSRMACAGGATPGASCQVAQPHACCSKTQALIPRRQPAAVIASVHGSSVLAASARLLSLRLRGGSPEGEDDAAAAAQPNATGSKRTKTWEHYDQDSNSDEDDDSKEWDYAKFGMTNPCVENGQSFNEHMTGVAGEPLYLGSDQFIGKWGWTGLHRAAVEGDVETLRKMLAMGGNANVPTHNGWTPLIEAASEGHTECVKLLLEHGANVSLPNKGGWSALHFAVGNAQMDTIRVLLASGADPLWQDCYGDYPMDKAMRNFEMDQPTLPLRCNVTMSIADRKALYWEAASAVNVSFPGGRDHVMNHSRFTLYATLLPGRRYSYDLDFEGEGMDHEDGTTDQYLGHDAYDADDKDFVNLDEAREASVQAYDNPELNEELMQFMNSGQEVEPPATSHANGVLDDEVEELLSRWRDEEYEQRLAQGIPMAATTNNNVGKDDELELD